MVEKIAVLGSNSFSGAHFVDRVLADGARVLGVSRSPPPPAPFLPYLHNPKVAAFAFKQLDMNLALDTLMAALREFQPTYVVNFAAQSMVAESWQHPEHWFLTNTLTQVKLHDRLRRLPSLEKYVHVSTPEVYGSCQGLVQEDAPYNPSTPYAVSRAAADMSLRSFFQTHRFPVVFTRAANVYGPGQQLYRIVPRTLLFGRQGKKLPLHGGGSSVRSFIHIRDVVDGTVRVMRQAAPGEIFHLSTTRQVSIRELVEMLASMMDMPVADLVENASERPGKDAAYLLDASKARRQLGWNDGVSLEEGLRATMQWVDTNLGELSHLPDSYQHKA